MAAIGHILSFLVGATVALIGLFSAPQERLNPPADDVDQVGETSPGQCVFSFGKCYLINNEAGELLGSDRHHRGYYRFGTSPKVFQVWRSRSFAGKARSEVHHVHPGESFYLWDVVGSGYSNGGSWMTAGPTLTYPGACSNEKFISFQVTMDSDGAIKLSIADISGLDRANHLGLEVQSNKYLRTVAEDKGIRIQLQEVGCPTDDEAGHETIYRELYWDVPSAKPRALSAFCISSPSRPMRADGNRRVEGPYFLRSRRRVSVDITNVAKVHEWIDQLEGLIAEANRSIEKWEAEIAALKKRPSFSNDCPGLDYFSNVKQTVMMILLVFLAVASQCL
ncbi:hypothetical protein FE257_000820 [Aspergillus nanangensis]|uniref:Uncharacterized protein n=1 Tax=Aspergillus nanangensis TaxID=2582783 RepID=A0AAD4GPZ4_ASPNN|nr:hypothetical protein FE257_000820 [Aspergillus nanangensis]